MKINMQVNTCLSTTCWALPFPSLMPYVLNSHEAHDLAILQRSAPFGVEKQSFLATVVPFSSSRGSAWEKKIRFEVSKSGQEPCQSPCKFALFAAMFSIEIRAIRLKEAWNVSQLMKFNRNEGEEGQGESNERPAAISFHSASVAAPSSTEWPTSALCRRTGKTSASVISKFCSGATVTPVCGANNRTLWTYYQTFPKRVPPCPITSTKRGGITSWYREIYLYQKKIKRFI